jgi:hypothetical protein
MNLIYLYIYSFLFEFIIVLLSFSIFKKMLEGGWFGVKIIHHH